MKVVVFLLAVLMASATFPSAAASVFCDNVKIVAETLPKNTSSSPVHFATATVGKAPDVVYAMAFCRGDIVNDTACAECVAKTFGRIFNETPPELECYQDAWYYVDCPVFYSSDNILAPSNTTDDEPFERWNVNVITGNDAGRIVGLIRDLLVQTVQKAASTAPLRFATGAMDSGTNFPMVYSLAQCTPDLSAGDCLACLQRLVGMINATMALRMGAQIHVMRCYFRYETSVFYDGQPMLRIGAQSPAPEPGPTAPTKGKSKLWVIPVVVVPLVAAASLCFVFYSPWFTRYRKGLVASNRSIPDDVDGFRTRHAVSRRRGHRRRRPRRRLPARRLLGPPAAACDEEADVARRGPWIRRHLLRACGSGPHRRGWRRIR